MVCEGSYLVFSAHVLLLKGLEVSVHHCVLVVLVLCDDPELAVSRLLLSQLPLKISNSQLQRLKRGVPCYRKFKKWLIIILDRLFDLPPTNNGIPAFVYFHNSLFALS